MSQDYKGREELGLVMHTCTSSSPGDRELRLICATVEGPHFQVEKGERDGGGTPGGVGR